VPDRVSDPDCAAALAFVAGRTDTAALAVISDVGLRLSQSLVVAVLQPARTATPMPRRSAWWHLIAQRFQRSLEDFSTLMVASDNWLIEPWRMER